MKVHGWMRMAVTALTAMAAAFGPCGCNDDDESSSSSSELDGYFDSHPFVIDPRSSAAASGVVSITPASAQVSQIGGRATFRAAGGSGSYKWDVANKAIGTISGEGAQGVYTAKAVGNNDVIVYDSDGNAALARISGMWTALTATADPDTLTPDVSYATLTAHGGQPPYTWTMVSSTVGAIVGSKVGESVVYRRDGSGQNVATVTDYLGATASVVIDQP